MIDIDDRQMKREILLHLGRHAGHRMAQVAFSAGHDGDAHVRYPQEELNPNRFV